MTYLSVDFLTSPEKYEEARAFWRSLLEEAQMRCDSKWQEPWLKEPPAELRDGNPIFTAWSPVFRRGLRVIQRPASLQIPDLSFWLDVFGGDLHEAGAVEELVLNCAPAIDLVPQLERLIFSWISGRPVSVSVDTPQLLTEDRQLVMPDLPQHVGQAA
jgi:hypothetical protein